MKIQQITTTSVISVLMLLNIATPTFALSPSAASLQEKVRERQELRQERVENRAENKVEKRCDIVNNRIDALISRYETNYQDVETRMTKVTEKTNELIKRLKAKGYDVSKLQSNLATLEEMKDTRRSLYTAFITELKEAKKYDCGDSKGAFKEAMNRSRTALAKWRDQIKTNRDYVKNTISYDLKALKEQNPNKSTTE